MEGLGKIIELDDRTRELYTCLDYRFFLEQHMNEFEFTDYQRQAIQDAYEKTRSHLLRSLKTNRRQHLFLIEGDVRKSHSGGSLPSHFKLDETRELEILDLNAVGEEMAYFEIWQKHERRKIRSKKIMSYVFRIGAIMGIVLTVIKIIEEIQ